MTVDYDDVYDYDSIVYKFVNTFSELKLCYLTGEWQIVRGEMKGSVGGY